MEVIVIDIGLCLEGDDIFFDIPRLVEMVRVLKLDNVIICAQRIGDLDAQDVTEAAVA